jgi:hypothetical protein
MNPPNNFFIREWKDLLVAGIAIPGGVTRDRNNPPLAVPYCLNCNTEEEKLTSGHVFKYAV